MKSTTKLAQNSPNCAERERGTEFPLVKVITHSLFGKETLKRENFVTKT